MHKDSIMSFFTPQNGIIQNPNASTLEFGVRGKRHSVEKHHITMRRKASNSMPKSIPIPNLHS